MESVAIAEGLIDGVKAVPITLWHGIERVVEFYSSEEEKEKIQGQNYRAYMALYKLERYGFDGLHSPLRRMVCIIVYHCYESLSENEKEKFKEIALKRTSYTVGKVYTTGQLSAIIARQVIKKLFVGTASALAPTVAIKAIVTELSLLGLLEKAGDSSDRLKALYPRLWRDLMLEDLDMLFFIVEKPMNKYLDAIRRRKWSLR